MKRKLITLLALAVSAYLSAAPDSHVGADSVKAPLVRVLADPLAFHGKTVLTRGFLFRDGDAWYVCYSTEAWKLDPGEAGVLLYSSLGGLFSPKDERLVSGMPVMIMGRLLIAKGVPANKGDPIRLYMEVCGEYGVRPFGRADEAVPGNRTEGVPSRESTKELQP